MPRLRFTAEHLDPFEDPREIAAYTILEAAHYLSIPSSTVNSWVRGTTYTHQGEKRKFRRVIDLPDQTQPLLSFFNLAEIHVLRSLRTVHGLSLDAIRKAVDSVRRKFGWKRPLIQEGFYTDGATLFVERLGSLIDAQI